MSPRLKVLRKVLNPPVIKGFKPYGAEKTLQDSIPVNLLYEEYEAMRLSDYDMLNHLQASVVMGVSRPTFTRIYASALQKIAKAFVEGRQILIEGGKVYFDSDWYSCRTCACYFNNPEKEKPIEKCPLCGTKQFDKFDSVDFKKELHDMHSDMQCVCTECGFEQEHEIGIPCKNVVCPKCGKGMKKKENKNCKRN